jgi:hypothetical protein
MTSTGSKKVRICNEGGVAEDFIVAVLRIKCEFIDIYI